jgi:hypothetical protein
MIIIKKQKDKNKMKTTNKFPKNNIREEEKDKLEWT